MLLHFFNIKNIMHEKYRFKLRNTFIQLKMYHYYKKNEKYIYIERAFTKLEKQI